MTPLSYASVNEHSAVVKLLLEKSAELESKEEKHGVTLLLWAAMDGWPIVPAQVGYRNREVWVSSE